MFRFQPSLPSVVSWTALVVVSSWTAQATDWPVLDYLYEIKGRGTVAGIHNRYSRTPTLSSDTAQEKGGKVPGLWSGDFLYDADNIDSRWIMINEAKRQYEKGALVNIMWHACNPTLSEPCNFSECNSGDGPWSDISESDWTQLVSPCERETNRQTDSTMSCCINVCLVDYRRHRGQQGVETKDGRYFEVLGVLARCRCGRNVPTLARDEQGLLLVGRPTRSEWVASPVPDHP
jgi:hypothetical protein